MTPPVPDDDIDDHADDDGELPQLALHLRPGPGAGEAALDRFGDELDAALAESGTGEFEGVELGPGECVLFFATTDAERTIATLRPLIGRSPFATGAEFELEVEDPDGVRRRERRGL
ncbi:MAG: hypothetical protein KDE27_27240 [Planctomycetes bacterium]|nr:hypothetical protein [Planctomycetota bacterium]